MTSDLFWDLIKLYFVANLLTFLVDCLVVVILLIVCALVHFLRSRKREKNHAEK